MLNMNLGYTKKMVVVAVVCAFVGCSTHSEDNGMQKEKTEVSNETVGVQTPESLSKIIQRKESELENKGGTNKIQLRLSLIDFYSSYVKLFPNDDRTPEMLFKAGNESINMEDYQAALGFYFRIEKKHQGYLKRPEALYLQGFIYDTYTNELGLAKMKYESLIEAYPSHALSSQAQLSMEHMGMSDEEIIRQFEKQNQ